MTVDFPLVLVSLELIMVCQECYHAQSIKIIAKYGIMIIDMSAKSISRTFAIPTFDEMDKVMRVQTRDIENHTIVR